MRGETDMEVDPLVDPADGGADGLIYCDNGVYYGLGAPA